MRETQSNYKVAIIGCGRVSKNHWGPINDIEGFELASICDLQPERGQPLADKLSVPFYRDYDTMLQERPADIVCVLTPSGMHPHHVIDIIEKYGTHIVVEKPMALSQSDLVRMRNAAEKAKVKIFPIYQNRYNKAVQRVRLDLSEGRLGKIALGTVRLRWCRPQPYYDRDPWRGTWAMDGGALTNQGIHYIDLLQYLAGKVESVSAKMATQFVDVEVEDTFVATVKFLSGALGVIEVTTASRPDDFEASISILAEKGTAILGGLACNQLDCYTLDTTAETECSVEIPDAYGFGHWDFFRDVLEDLDGGKPHPISFETGCDAINLLNALYRSAEEGREVFINEKLASKRLGEENADLKAIYLAEATQA